MSIGGCDGVRSIRGGDSKCPEECNAGIVVVSRTCSRASSIWRSCSLRLFERFVRRCKANGGSNSKSVRRRTREQATNVSPEENSFLPMSTTTLSRVSPCAL